MFLFLKDAVQSEIDSNREQIEVNIYLWIIYYLEKLSTIVDRTISSQIGILIIDLVKSISKSNRENFIFNENTQIIADICEKYSFLIENNDENLSLVLQESLKSLLI
jgi:hypothetical protein